MLVQPPLAPSTPPQGSTASPVSFQPADERQSSAPVHQQLPTPRTAPTQERLHSYQSPLSTASQLNLPTLQTWPRGGEGGGLFSPLLRDRSGLTTTSHIVGTKVQREMQAPREIETRVISSKIVEEAVIGQVPTDYESQRKTERLQQSIRRVAVPRHPTSPSHDKKKKEVKPQTTTTQRSAKISRAKTPTPLAPRIEEVIKRVPVKKVVEVPREVIKTVRKPEKRQVTKEIEVPGERVEVVKKIIKERKVDNPVYVDRKVPVIVSQTHEPRIDVIEGGSGAETVTDRIRVEVRQINPVIVPVDIFVPVPVVRPLFAKGRKDFERRVEVPPSHFNGLVRRLNPHLVASQNENDQRALCEVYMRDITAAAIPILPDHEFLNLVTPASARQQEDEEYLKVQQDETFRPHVTTETTTTMISQQNVYSKHWSTGDTSSPTVLVVPATKISPWASPSALKEAEVSVAPDSSQMVATNAKYGSADLSGVGSYESILIEPSGLVNLGEIAPAVFSATSRSGVEGEPDLVRSVEGDFKDDEMVSADFTRAGCLPTPPTAPEIAVSTISKASTISESIEPSPSISCSQEQQGEIASRAGSGVYSGPKSVEPRAASALSSTSSYSQQRSGVESGVGSGAVSVSSKSSFSGVEEASGSGANREPAPPSANSKSTELQSVGSTNPDQTGPAERLRSIHSYSHSSHPSNSRPAATSSSSRSKTPSHSESFTTKSSSVSAPSTVVSSERLRYQPSCVTTGSSI